MLELDTLTTWGSILVLWSFRPIFLITVCLMGVLHSRGMQAELDTSLEALRNDHKPGPFYASIFILFLALVSPIDQLANQIFFIRVAQHILLLSVFPALFMASDPLPVLYAGLPDRIQPFFDRLCVRLYGFMEKQLTKGVCWFIFIAAVWLWYDPTLLETTITRPAIRNIELTTMLVGAMLHWWHVNAAYPRIHPRLPAFAHMGYTLAGAGPLKIPGLFFLFSLTPFYSFEPINFLGNEISPLLSQQIGGAVIWLLAGTVYTFSFVRFFGSWLGVEEAKPPRPIDDLEDMERYRAPHLEETR